MRGCATVILGICAVILCVGLVGAVLPGIPGFPFGRVFMPLTGGIRGLLLLLALIVIVRLLVLPGHLRCCALPALRQLSGLGLEGVQVSLASRYVPHWRCVDVPGPLGRPVSEAEVEAVRQMAEQLGLSLAAPGLEIAEVSDGERGSLIGSKRRDVAHSKEAP